MGFFILENQLAKINYISKENKWKIKIKLLTYMQPCMFNCLCICMTMYVEKQVSLLKTLLLTWFDIHFCIVVVVGAAGGATTKCYCKCCSPNQAKFIGWLKKKKKRKIQQQK